MNLDNYDELQNSKNSIDSFEEKMGNLNLILSGVAFSTLSIPILSNLNLTKVEEAIGVGASMLVVTPLWYCGFKKLAAKSNKKLDKDMHHMNQLMLMLMETREKDRRIGELTASFFEEICDAENQNGIRLSFDNKNNLNQFIYMINSNYYDRIALNLPSITRELLVEKIINLAFLYLKETGKNDFTHKDVSKILEGCYYIKDDLKKEIIKEFRKSRAKIGDKYIYQIVRNDMDIDKNDNIYLDKKKKETEKNPRLFDVYNIKDYELILSILQNQEEYNKYGNINSIEWNLEFLKDLMCFIVENFKKSLYEEHSEYCNFDMVASFMHNVAVYSLVNNKEGAYKDEIIKTFKNWPYLSTSLKMEILDAIFNEFGLDFNDNPYHKTYKKKSKILKFPINNGQNE